MQAALVFPALRAAGVPARIAGTPAWNRVQENGNHNWVEVYDHQTKDWYFIEAAPAGGGESLTNPCDKWFCSPGRMENGTQVYSTRWEFDTTGTVYPLAWDMGNKEVPGVDRTDYYQKVCNKCWTILTNGIKMYSGNNIWISFLFLALLMKVQNYLPVLCIVLFLLGFGSGYNPVSDKTNSFGMN